MYLNPFKRKRGTSGSSGSSSVSLQIDETRSIGSNHSEDQESTSREKISCKQVLAAVSSSVSSSNNPDRSKISYRLGQGTMPGSKKSKNIWDEDDNAFLPQDQQPSVLFTPEDRILKQKVTISQQANTGRILEQDMATKLKERQEMLRIQRMKLEKEEAQIKQMTEEAEEKRRAENHLAKKREEQYRAQKNNNSEVYDAKMKQLELQKILAEKDREIAEKDVAIARLNTVIAQKEASFTQKFAQAQHFIFQLTTKLENLEKKDVGGAGAKKRLGVKARVGLNVMNRLGEPFEEVRVHGRKGQVESDENAGFYDESNLDEEDILTEFGENGPVPAKKLRK